VLFVQEELSNSWQKVGLMKEEEFAVLRESQQTERARTIEQERECVSPPTPPLPMGDTKQQVMIQECPEIQRRPAENLENGNFSNSLPGNFGKSERRTEEAKTDTPLNRCVSQPVNGIKDKVRFYAVPLKAQMNSTEENKVDKVNVTFIFLSVWLFLPITHYLSMLLFLFVLDTNETKIQVQQQSSCGEPCWLGNGKTTSQQTENELWKVGLPPVCCIYQLIVKSIKKYHCYVVDRVACFL
jgi:hypothetical protein